MFKQVYEELQRKQEELNRKIASEKRMRLRMFRKSSLTSALSAVNFILRKKEQSLQESLATRLLSNIACRTVSSGLAKAI